MDPKNISSNFTREDNFKISGVSLDDIAKELPTPFFVYDMDTIKDKYSYLRYILPEEVDIFYAMKANPNKTIVKILTDQGSGVEVASKGELMLCKELNIDPKNIVFAGPAKTNEDLEYAIDMGIYAINSESVKELSRISNIASEKNKIVDVELRINPKFHIEGAAVNMGGGSKKFGIDSENIKDVIYYSQFLPNINLQGIHVFSATGILSQEGFISNLRNCFKLAEQVNQKFKVKSIDVGGGIGIPYSDNDKELSIEGISSNISDLINEYSFIKQNGTRLIVEPGRYLVGQSGIYVTQVVDTKHSRGTDYVLVDGGIQHLLRPALINSKHPTFNLSRTSDNEISQDVGGSLCTSLDFLTKDENLPEDTSVGDYIGVFCSGAYGYTESMPLFLSHDFASEVLVHNNKYSIIRKPIKVQTILDTQEIPEELK